MKIEDYTETWYYTNLWDNYDGMTSIDKFCADLEEWLEINAGKDTYKWRDRNVS